MTEMGGFPVTVRLCCLPLLRWQRIGVGKMEVIYGLIPGMIIMGLVAVAIFFWAARSGQFDDLQGEANRILMDDDLDDVEEDVAGDESSSAAESLSVSDQSK